MILRCWNCRGLGNHRTIHDLSLLVQEKQPKLVFLMEIKIDAIRMEIIKRRIGFEGCIAINSLGSRGGLALLWRSRDQVNIENYSQHHISAWVTDPTIRSLNSTFLVFMAN